MGDVFSTGVTGLNVAQAALNAIANNVSNANTAGYARQVLDTSDAAGTKTGYGYQGNGVTVTGIESLVNTFLEAQLTAATSASAGDAQSSTYFNQLQSVIADSASGISTAQSTFQSSLATVATNPSSIPARQQVLAGATALASAINNVAGQLQTQKQGVAKTITATVATANSLLTQIAKLNDTINKSEPRDSSGKVLPGQENNDLRNQRQQLINQLGQIASVTTTDQSDGVTVSIGGAAVVVSNHASKLATAPDPSDPVQLTVGVQTPTGQETLSVSTLGGQLGAALSFVSTGIDQSIAQLNQYAGVVSQALNDQSAKGVDLYGSAGSPLFASDAAQVASSSLNTGNQTVSVSVNAYATQPSDYSLAYSAAGGYSLTRSSDGTIVTSGTTLPLTADGLTISAVAGSPADGDTYAIKPFGNAASNLTVAIKDPKQLALSNPVASAANAANTSTATITAPTVTSGLPLNANIKTPVSIVFTSATQYTITGAGIPGSPLASQSYVSGQAIAYNGWSVSISGAPKAGDQFKVGPSTGAQGDGANANAIVSLLQGKNFEGGSASLSDLYASVQSDTGNKASLAQTNAISSASVLTIAQNQRSSYSGVNLDQEAADLTRWQQIYSANAHVMSIAQTLFQDLLNKLG